MSMQSGGAIRLLSRALHSEASQVRIRKPVVDAQDYMAKQLRGQSEAEQSCQTDQEAVQ